MKKTIILLSLMLIVIMVVSCSTAESTPSMTPEASEQDETGYGAIGSFKDSNPTLEQMLIYAIQDEYLARSEYEYIISEMGGSAPFTNIIKAEQTHIDLLIPLFTQYEFALVEDTSKDHLIVPSTITQALETGVQAEIDNIAMYESFLKMELPDDVRSVFESLKNASVGHLSAFERKLGR